MKDQFYLNLPSNSSMRYFPKNTVSHYITQLPRNLKMTGEWVVALVEIQFPRTFLHIDKPETPYGLSRPLTVQYVPKLINRSMIDTSERKKPAINLFNILTLDAKDPTDHVDFLKEKPPIISPKPREISIPGGLYGSVNALIASLNDTVEFAGHVQFEYSERTGGLVKIRRILEKCNPKECTKYHLIRLNDKLSKILGFPPGEPIDVHEQSTTTAKYPASLSLAFPDKLFVYSDICESYITGDVQTPLLRIVPVDNTNYIYGTTQTKSFSPTIYIPLLKTEFTTIEIDIRTDTGEPVPFESGTLTTTLHFKRIG